MHPVDLSVMAQRKKERERKKNFSEAEIEIILGEVDLRKNILFSSVSSGVTGTGKAKAWREVTDAVNVVSVVQRTMSEVKRKWFDMKLEAKKRISTHKKNYSGHQTNRRFICGVLNEVGTGNQRCFVRNG
ncbi:SANT/Myb-like DNA-binding domain-containing protein [Vibrio parahaemolyticus]|nr:SANT/Myb-like DNA-binding domain-containing protein [Vibrio parahaemolyticus]